MNWQRILLVVDHLVSLDRLRGFPAVFDAMLEPELLGLTLLRWCHLDKLSDHSGIIRHPATGVKEKKIPKTLDTAMLRWYLSRRKEPL